MGGWGGAETEGGWKHTAVVARCRCWQPGGGKCKHSEEPLHLDQETATGSVASRLVGADRKRLPSSEQSLSPETHGNSKCLTPMWARGGGGGVETFQSYIY